MQISLRSQLIAGTAAVVGASAIAMTPVTGAHLSLPSVQVPSAAQVALAGFDSPLSELLGTVFVGGQLLFNADLPPGAALSWGPSAFFQPLPWIANPLNGGFATVGLLPQIIDDALPIIRQLGINGSDYLAVTAGALTGAGIDLSEGVWTAAGQLLSLDISGALSTLFTSIDDAGTLALGAGTYVLSNVVARAQAVVELVVASAGYVLAATVAQISAVVARTVQIVEATAAQIGAGSFEGAWNAAVNGIFGPSGLPGLILNLTIGAGQQTDVIPPGEGPNVNGTAPLGTNFIPSTRMVVQQAVKGIAGALSATVPLPVAATAAAEAPAPAPAPAAAALAAVEVSDVAVETAVEVPADTSAIAAVTESDAPAADAPVSPRGARSAAVEAPAASAGDDDGAAKSTPKRAARGAKKASSAE